MVVALIADMNGYQYNEAKDIANFTKTNYGQLASHARGLIVKDMNKGVMQNGIFKYKSKEYAAKKATGALGKF